MAERKDYASLFDMGAAFKKVVYLKIGVVAVFLHPWIKYSLCLMLKGY
jgi:hypothetical protein